MPNYLFRCVDCGEEESFTWTMSKYAQQDNVFCSKCDGDTKRVFEPVAINLAGFNAP